MERITALALAYMWRERQDGRNATEFWFYEDDIPSLWAGEAVCVKIEHTVAPKEKESEA